MRKALTLISIACMVVPQVGSAQTAALQHLLRYKRTTTTGTCSLPGSGRLATFDPSVSNTVYKEIAGSTAATVDGDTVGMLKEANASGFNLVATADSSVRPTFGTSGGLYWINFTQSSSQILINNSALGVYSGGAATMIFAVRLTATGSNGNVFSEGSSINPTGTLYAPVQQLAGDLNDSAVTLKDDSGAFPIVSSLQYDEAYPPNTDVTVIVVDTGSSFRTYIDGVADRAATSYTRATSTFGRFSLGGAYRQTTVATPLDGRIYYAGFYNFAFDATQIANATACLKAKQGR